MNIKIIIRNLIQHYKTCRFMIKLAKKNPDAVYIVSLTHIGDICHTMSYMHEYKHANPDKRIIIIGNEKMKQLYTLYQDSYDDILFYPPKVSENLRYTITTKFGDRIYRTTHQFLLTNPWYYIRPSMNRIEEVTVNKITKHAVYELPASAKVRFPLDPDSEIGEYVKKLHLAKDKSVIIAPYANTVKVPMTIFENIASVLKNRGYTVITNTSKGFPVPVPGTDALECSIYEFYNLAQYCGNVVGLRSGLLDFIVNADCKVISVVSDDYKNKNLCSLLNWNIDNDLKNVYELTISDGSNICNKIVEIIDNLR